MNKYALALRHSFASWNGWLRLRSQHPAFAKELLRRRWQYFKRREFEPGYVTPDGFVLDTPDTLVAYWSMFVERELYSDAWAKVLQSTSQPLVVDVGANAGMFSHFTFCLNQKSQIIAFEPLPAMVERINSLKQRNAVNLRCIAKAVGRSAGSAMLESPHGYDGTSRICVFADHSDNAFQVEVTTLDRELEGHDVLVMKIDVEGFEEEVIWGAANTLARTRFLIIEAHDAAQRDHLTRLLGPQWSRQKLGSSDYLFSR